MKILSERWQNAERDERPTLARGNFIDYHYTLNHRNKATLTLYRIDVHFIGRLWRKRLWLSLESSKFTNRELGLWPRHLAEQPRLLT